MQTLFDLPMSSSLSYLVAIIVILGLLAIFAVIVRRVAGQGLRMESGRGRGPRLGVVDTYSLDRTRQLVLIRRDDVEHLVMIGGTNDVLIESNIVRAISAASLREPQNPMLAQYDAPIHRGLADDDQLYAPQSAPVMPPQAPQPQAPRVKMAPQPAPQPQPSFAPQSYAPRSQAQVESDPIAEANQAAAREALNNAELQALAKRLEASIPPLQPKAEKPPVQQQVSLAPEPRPTPHNIAMPQAAPMPQPAPAPIQPPAPPAPQPVAPVIQAPQMAPPAPQAPVAQPYAPPQMPQMPQPRPPVMPAQQPIPQQPAAPIPVAPSPIAPAQVAPPPVAPAPVQAEPPKDRQAAALDENLRRLLGRKLDQR